MHENCKRMILQRLEASDPYQAKIAWSLYLPCPIGMHESLEMRNRYGYEQHKPGTSRNGFLVPGANLMRITLRLRIRSSVASIFGSI